jgi:hypothetical protein
MFAASPPSADGNREGYPSRKNAAPVLNSVQHRKRPRRAGTQPKLYSRRTAPFIYTQYPSQDGRAFPVHRTRANCIRLPNAQGGRSAMNMARSGTSPDKPRRSPRALRFVPMTPSPGADVPAPKSTESGEKRGVNFIFTVRRGERRVYRAGRSFSSENHES